MLLWPINIKILQAYNLALGIRHLLTHIAIKKQFGEGIWIQSILALIPLTEAIFTTAIGGSRGSIEERNSMIHAEMQYSLGILIVSLHHVVYIVFHSIGASSLMENNLYITTINILMQNSLKEIVLVHIIQELQTTKIAIALIFLFAVIQIINNQNILTALTIQFLNNITADKAGTTSYNNHLSSCSFFVKTFCNSALLTA